MRKMKRGLAAALAVTMVMGSSLTVFAADNSGSTSGDGTSEGHVEKKATKVVLPTVADGDTPFAYIMDPERLISGTNGGKYDGFTFPEADTDSGVYFQTDTTKYENSSKKLKVVNQSSHDISLTVKAEVESAETDIPLAERTAVDSAQEATLYLGLVVDTESPVALAKDTAATKTITVAGKEENFKVDVKSDKSGYEYRELTVDEYKALDGADANATVLPWESKEFQLEGSVTKDAEITDSMTAPTVTVTWSWVDPSATPVVTISETGLITVSELSSENNFKSLTITDETGQAMNWNIAPVTWGTDNWNAEDGGTFTIQLGEQWMNYLNQQGGTAKVIVTLADDSTIESEVVTLSN